MQSRFERDIGVDEVTALVDFHLAPLAVRRDIAMLGFVHRTVLGNGLPHVAEHFKRQSESLHDLRKGCKAFSIKRSALGLVAVYNMLPAPVVASNDVSEFQRALQHLVKERAKAGREDWKDTLNPRIPLSKHPLA